MLTQITLQCASTEDLAAQIASSLPDAFDKECVIEALKEIDPAELQDPASAAIQAAMTDCLTGG